jgi:hypothetical protein
MRLPALAIATAFAGGMALGLHPAVARNASSLRLLAFSFFIVAVLVGAGILLLTFGRLSSAAAASLLTWVFLGFLGAVVAEQPRPVDHVVSLVEQGRIALHTPLRWHGRLRDEPARLPWGYGYEIELSGVSFQEELHSTRGGLRLSFSTRPDQQVPSDLHAGDEVTVLAEAKQPQLFKDEGAFDRRTYLAQQNIDLVATLRAPELIRLVSPAKPTDATRLAIRWYCVCSSEPAACCFRVTQKNKWKRKYSGRTVRSPCARMFLKVGHHGSKNSTTPEFLGATQPRVGIISAGEGNPYGHPSPELLEGWKTLACES